MYATRTNIAKGPHDGVTVNFTAGWDAIDHMVAGKTEVSVRVRFSKVSAENAADALLAFASDRAFRAELQRRGLVVAPNGWSLVHTPRSSFVKRIAYNEAKQEMVLEFGTISQSFATSRQHRLTRYLEVPPAIFHGLANAESAGQYYNDHVKGQYPSARTTAFPGDPVLP